jgi:hypothetical protein
MKRRPPPINKLLPVLRGAVEYTSQRAQAPMEIALVGALCCFATVFQGIAKIRDRYGNLQPLSLHGYVKADSGDGKSPSMEILAHEIRKFDDDFESARANFENRRLAKTLQLERNLSALTRESAKLMAKGEETAHLDKQIEDALNSTEEGIYAPGFMCADSSSSGVISLLRYRFPFALLGEDEGNIVLNSGAFENSGLLISLWDKMRYKSDRAHKSIELRAGLTVFSAVQGDILNGLLRSKAGRTDVVLGKFARGIWTFPESIQGQRDFSVLPPEELISPYHSVLRLALNKYRDGLPCPLVLELSPDARFLLGRYQKLVERQLRDDGFFREMRPQANKSALIALRLAGLVHMGEGFEGPISPETAKVAIRLAAFFLWEYRCEFCPLTEVERHAALLTKAIDAYFEDNPGSLDVPRRHFLRHADPAIRHVETLDPAARHLEGLGEIRLQHFNRGTWNLGVWRESAPPPPPDPLVSGRSPISPGRLFGPVRPEPPKPQPFDEEMLWPGISMPDL